MHPEVPHSCIGHCYQAVETAYLQDMHSRGTLRVKGKGVKNTWRRETEADIWQIWT